MLSHYILQMMTCHQGSSEERLTRCQSNSKEAWNLVLSGSRSHGNLIQFTVLSATALVVEFLILKGHSIRSGIRYLYWHVLLPSPLIPCSRLVSRRELTRQDGTERRGSKDALEWKQGGRRRRLRGYNFVFHGCGTNRSRGLRRNENSPQPRPVEQRVPPVLGVPNVGRNASSYSVPFRPTYQRALVWTGRWR
ncbi:unnamed protein product [Malus baccata var. baccata]